MLSGGTCDSLSSNFGSCLICMSHLVGIEVEIRIGTSFVAMILGKSQMFSGPWFIHCVMNLMTCGLPVLLCV